MHTLIENGLSFEIVSESNVIATWNNWKTGEPCGSAFAIALVENFADLSLPSAWVKGYLRSPLTAIYGGGNWLIPTSDGRLLHFDGSTSIDEFYEPVSLSEAVLDVIVLIKHPSLVA